MDWDFDACYAAVVARDARFDGRLFTGVLSTGVYCRPSCPSRTPLRRNVVFHRSAAAAEQAGLRACRRCRPEAAPGSAEGDLQSPLAVRALRAIEAGVVDRDGVEGLAAGLHVSVRHLHRVLVADLGAGASALARARRLRVARELLDTTALAVTDIAFGAGFSSVRRFNAEMRRSFGATPTQLRAGRPAAAARGIAHDASSAGGGATLGVRIPVRGQHGFDQLLAFLAPRAIAGVEEIGGGRYRRAHRTAGGPVTVTVEPAADAALAVTVAGASLPDLAGVIAAIRHLCDTDADTDAVAGTLGARDPLLRPLLRRRPGLRLPGAADGFELAVRAILGQRVSVRAATVLCNRLVSSVSASAAAPAAPAVTVPAAAAATGAAVPAPGATAPDTFAAMDPPSALVPFPHADRVAAADLDRVGLPEPRRRAVRALARSVAQGRLDLGPTADPERTHAALLALPGVGPWTAGYILMRALRVPDAWPQGDLGMRRALERLTGKTISTTQLAARAERWRPWRGYAAMHLWASLTDELPADGARALVTVAASS